MYVQIPTPHPHKKTQKQCLLLVQTSSVVHKIILYWNAHSTYYETDIEDFVSQ